MGNKKPVIELKEVELGYRGKPVVRRLNCVIERGDSLGIVGPNGSGKTTLLKAILGLIPPLSGEIHTDMSLRFAYVPQTEMLSLRLPLTVRDVVYLALKSRRSLGWITADERQAAERAMERVGIAPIRNQTLRDCSGGQRQRAILAQALSQKPDVLLLDEPTKGLDVASEHAFLSLMEELKAEENLTILFVTHVLQIPLNYMKKILVLSQGVGVLSTPDELISTRKLDEIYGVTFVRAGASGVRWATPLRGKS